MKLKNALISVYAKDGIVDFAKVLSTNNLKIISTGGTALILEKNEIITTRVEELTNFPEILDGRVKTLHPKIHGGILAKRDNKKHVNTLESLNVTPIDIVVVNLYPFSEIKKNVNSDENQTLEGIDIGGPTLIRAAAKNYKNVLIVVDPNDYESVGKAIINNSIDINFRRYLAYKAFKHTLNYESQINLHFQELVDIHITEEKKHKNINLEIINLNLTKKSDLRYGENPHQNAASYIKTGSSYEGLLNSNKVQGKPLSFNNLVDSDTAVNCVKMFKSPASVIVKHANPCGVAEATSIENAFIFSKETDPLAAFGGVVAFNSRIEDKLALLIIESFFEVIIAPSISNSALQIFKNKEKLRVLISKEIFSNHKSDDELDIKSINGGYLVQNRDYIDKKNIFSNIVTQKKPTHTETEDLKFAWKVSHWIKSNAIVFCKNKRTLGIGAGQMSRVDAVKIAAIKAKETSQSLKGSVVASDAFFPFSDSVEILAREGARSIIQPGGSIRDQEVIEAANKKNISMIFTNQRHFRH